MKSFYLGVVNMKNNDLLVNLVVKANEEKVIDLENIYPLGTIKCDNIISIAYKVDGDWNYLKQFDSFENETARFIKILVDKDCPLSIFLGLGFIATKAEDWTSLFSRKNGWAGSDGIFSFNLTDGNDSFEQKEPVNTLFVFGDTLIGKVDKKTNQRLYPISMPSNSIAYLQGNEPKVEKINFKFNTDEFDSIIPYYQPQTDAQYGGTLPNNLCKYLSDKPLTPWLSGYSPKKVELLFDLYDQYEIEYIDFYNYFLEKQPGYDLESRGIKEFTLYASNELENWHNLGKQEIKKASNLYDFTRIIIQDNYRYFKMIVTPIQGVGNHYVKEDDCEVVFGLNKVKFYSHNTLLTDIAVSASSIMQKTKLDSVFWLQDGVVINDKLFFLPLQIIPDMTKPEGMQFAVKEISLVKTPIVNGYLDVLRQTQKDTPLFVEKDGVEWLYGCAFMAHTVQAGAYNAEGYIYIYGYKTQSLLRGLIVARVQSEDFEHINKWQYYSENGWVQQLTEAKTLLENISCEMSISPITSGENKGKYLAVFQYDVTTEYVAYSIGDTPVGPFTNPRKIYQCPEVETLGGMTYTYNAKAHPHLSSSQNVLVSYNVNTYSMSQNEANSDVYHPRFIRLMDTSRRK